MPKREFELENNQEATSGTEKRRKIDCDDARTLVANIPGLGLAHVDYTVGWVCAITTEYVAAQAFLDEKHRGPEYVSPNDSNHYTLGKIGKHNVVIAVLPDGEYGTSSAAGVARDMLHSFPNIRIGLMVGIGGGAPSRKYDIRLGDIVVSAPHGGEGSVFQYDFGKTIQDQNFRPMGFLNQPPMVLRTAVSGLKAQYESEGHQLEEAINRILEKKSRLQKKYQRPGPRSDRLYQTGVIHPPNDEASCAEVCGDDSLILRHQRAEDEDNPAIHYGLIASANQLMKDALLRDKFAMEKDVLCFEMEAAGLMNQFPCLVIRGICDYSDTHKNKEWQGYAAMAAAAYAKDLLYQIPANKIETENRISDLLSGDAVLNTVSRTRANVETMTSKLDRNEDLEILNWLTPIDYGPQQSDLIKRRQEGTGTWLLHTNKFNTWLNQRKKALYCSGIPGAGKTILTSIVIDHLCSKYRTDFSVGIAYLYCNFRQQHQQKPEDLLLSLLKQLAQKRMSVPESIKTLYEYHNRERTRPSFNEILEALESVAAQYSRVLIIVDALDECSVFDGGRQKFLSAIFNLQGIIGANIFATSRINDNIAKLFEAALSLQIRARNEDVESYLDRQMSLLQPDILDDALRGMIRGEVIRAVDGMFLLAQLHMDTIMDQPTKGDIKEALQHLTKGINGLDETYKQAMERIEHNGSRIRELAKRILAWIIHAKRPLSTAELQHALGVRPLTKKLDRDYIPSVQVLQSVCAGLVTIDEQSGIVRLVHYTTQEYFERTWTSWFPNAQIDITNTCVTYLSFDVFETGFCRSDREFETRLQANVLYDYAARNWGHHAHTASIEEDLILSFLENRSKVSAASQAMMASRNYSGYSQGVPRQMTGIHVAAYFGLVGTIMALLKDGHNPNVQDSYHRTPLLWAAMSGHGAVVKLLLENGAELEFKDSNRGRTPLSWAAEKGHDAVVKLLLEKGSELESKDFNNGWTPLLWAAVNGHDAVVKLLLENDAELESKDSDYGWTPLSWAAVNGHDAVVRLLLEKGAELEPKGPNSGRTPLSWAAEKGHDVVVKLLLENGAELESKDPSFGWTPLSWAAEKGHDSVVKLLLENGAELESKDSIQRRTPLSWAAVKGHDAVVKLLLEKGAELESKDPGYGRTPLSWAAEKGHDAVVRLLLEKGAELESKDPVYGRTPLSWAAQEGHDVVVRLLLEKCAELESKDPVYGRTPLSWAAEEGHEAIVKLLLKTGKVSIDSKDKDGRTPLSWAVEGMPWLWAPKKGHEAIVKLLLETGKVDVDLKDNSGRTPLSWAAEKRHEAIVKLLLETGKVDVDSKDNSGWTPQLWTKEEMRLFKSQYCENHALQDYRTQLVLLERQNRKRLLMTNDSIRCEAVVKLLLVMDGVNPNPKGTDGRTPLSWAAEKGHETIVKLLLETDKVDVDSKDNSGRTPLSWAAEEGHEAIVKLLLKTGKVNIDSKDKDGRTPLSRVAGRVRPSWVAKTGHKTVAKLLLVEGAKESQLSDPAILLS
ncbi:hypothetical protein FGG08_005151 [Glutinoglossum americanum]|uniref:Nucleoside phosphorylase domain-containing protein n=1 Tax=Glutinoglossum americanum TaxID=1670608 RepID=A0A9P8L226_9PEZI|nr:hypothetical protein FGG08_005151 [Glutinoglossum americanum]